jgi:hypothetical protein
MRYDPSRKLQRNRGIVKFKKAHPELSWGEIGAEFGISDEAARAAYNRTLKSDAQRRS